MYCCWTEVSLRLLWNRTKWSSSSSRSLLAMKELRVETMSLASSQSCVLIVLAMSVKRRSPACLCLY
ncbi:hypothetical protein ALO64_200044 [Pseudomonas meliae]|uniref:Uncharacterized protein n=1 Tax=Pseudomonas meliae TaxID=86176 RepID=A0A0P9UMG1_9PSED|nr:hypothetical protein ALO64_200044 [Pseudomonas meliae]